MARQLPACRSRRLLAGLTSDGRCATCWIVQWPVVGRRAALRQCMERHALAPESSKFVTYLAAMGCYGCRFSDLIFTASAHSHTCCPGTLRLAYRGIPPCSLRRCASYKESFEVRISRPAHPMHTPGRHTKQRCTLRRRSAAADGPVIRPRERPVRDLRNVGGVGSRQLYAEYLRCLGSLRCQQHLYTARFTC